MGKQEIIIAYQFGILRRYCQEEVEFFLSQQHWICAGGVL
jgi:hypothetical protein